jgi:hypothetical protein
MDGLCPISHALMADPVIASDGHTYDRQSIEQWFSTGSRMSPMTNLPLPSLDLTPNILVRQMMAAIPRPPKVYPEDKSRVDIVEHRSKFGSVLQIQSTLVDALPVHIVAAIDISGSMQSAASKGEDNGVSLLDLVKKCMEMLIKMLRPADRLSLLAYSADVKVLARREFMTDDGKRRMLKRITNLKVDGMTNFFGSLEKSFELCKDSDNAVIFNFTDGHPNVREPPRGYTHALGRLPALAPLYAFGFGNKLSSAILVEASAMCQGRFVHIPTVNFVGTSFGHAIANVRETLRRNVKLICHDGGDEVEIANVSIKNGTSVGICIPSDLIDIRVVADGKTLYKGGHPSIDSDFALVHIARANLATLLKEAMGVKRNREKDTSAVNAWVEETTEMLKSCTDTHAKTLRGFLKYFQGDSEDDAQVLKALDLTDTKYWDDWGKHYVRSLYFALKHQECHNFKDEGVQGFGGSIFEAERDKASELYMTLPPIQPSRASMTAAALAPVYTHSYNCSGGCFDGRTLVTKAADAKGTVRRPCPLYAMRKGDFAIAGDGTIAQIECLLYTPGGTMDLYCVKHNGSRVYATAYHPISVDHGKTWQHPKSIGTLDTQQRPFGVYSFLLCKRNGGRPHSLLLEGEIAGISLAHGIAEKLPKHMQSNFWDTEAVAMAIQDLPGHEHGCALVSKLQRHPETNLVIGFE